MHLKAAKTNMHLTFQALKLLHLMSTNRKVQSYTIIFCLKKKTKTTANVLVTTIPKLTKAL